MTTPDIYDPSTWVSLKQRQRELRDALWDLYDEPWYSLEKEGKLLLELDEVTKQIRNGHLYEVPW